MSQCDHQFINQNPGVEKLLRSFKNNCNTEEIQQAQAILSICPECSLEFYRELLTLLKDFVGSHRNNEQKSLDRILPWAMHTLGYSYSQIEKKLGLSPSTIHDQVYQVRDYLINVEVAFFSQIDK